MEKDFHPADVGFSKAQGARGLRFDQQLGVVLLGSLLDALLSGAPGAEAGYHRPVGAPQDQYIWV